VLSFPACARTVLNGTGSQPAKGRTAQVGLGIGRMALPADLDLLAGLLPSLSTLTAKERDTLFLMRM